MRNFNNMPEAEYQEYMKHRNAAYNAFNAIMGFANKIDLEKLAYMRKAAEINADNGITETRRADLVQEAYQNAMRNLGAFWLTAEKLFPTFAEELDAITERLDLNDARLPAAVSLLNAAGVKRDGGVGAMPSGIVQAALIEPFAGNHEALMTLRGLADSLGLADAVARIDNHVSTLEKAQMFAGYVEQRMYEASLSAESAFMQPDIAGYVDAVCEVYGFTRPEPSEELHLVAMRLAMGLPVGFPDGVTMEGAKVDGKPVYTVTGLPVTSEGAV